MTTSKKFHVAASSFRCTVVSVLMPNLVSGRRVLSPVLIAMSLAMSVPVAARQTPGQGFKAFVSIDCYGSGDISNTGTRNTVTVSMNGEVPDRFTVAATNDDCEPNAGESLLNGVGDYYGIRKSTIVVRAYPPQSITISTNGDDAFWIDQLSFRAGAFGGHWGVNGARGYCLSTDPTDADRTWKDKVGSRGCRPCWLFRIVGVGTPYESSHVVECTRRDDGRREE